MKKTAILFIFLISQIVVAQNYRATTILKASENFSIDIIINQTNNTVTFTLTGPTNVYSAIGFNADRMNDNPYTIFTQSDNLQERKLGNRGAGTLLTPSVTIASDEINNNIRTIVFTRPTTISSNYYDFSQIQEGSSVDVIWAVGNGFGLSRHAIRGSSSLNFDTTTELSTPKTTVSNSALFEIQTNLTNRSVQITNTHLLNSIEIYNAKYQVVKRLIKNQIQENIDISELSNGVYFIKCIGKDQTYITKKVIL